MLKLRRLEVDGFGPFAEKQTLEFPSREGVVVVYGENMRGKTALLNAVRYAFFGVVLGRGSRRRRLHTVVNRDLAATGRNRFLVSLAFEHDGQDYELVRSCESRIERPADDSDYEESVLLRRGRAALGPQERDQALQRILPQEVSRFFLFDGELLQEYEQLLISESDEGDRISEAIERILGLPILKRGRIHLTRLAEEAELRQAKEASKHKETKALGAALEQAVEQRDAHQAEIERLGAQMRDLSEQRAEGEQYLKSVQRYATILEERDGAQERLGDAESSEKALRSELQRAMSDAWRTLLREPVRVAREQAQHEAEREAEAVVDSLRADAVETGRCRTCGRDLSQAERTQLKGSVPEPPPDSRGVGISAALTRLADLNKFKEVENTGEVRQLWKQLEGARFDQAHLADRIRDLNAALADSDPDSIRKSKLTYGEVVEKIGVVRKALDDEKLQVREKDENIQRLQRKLESSGGTNLAESRLRASTLRASAETIGAAVEQYKSALRQRVEETASRLFLAMTTEQEDYVRLGINENYGLQIYHADGRAEEARSAGAEHVVALALMGALQGNAPLRGPIVMDSPFGRLDEGHTTNVVRALPQMAEQVVLLVYEAEVGRDRMRELLGSALTREYELERVSARRTNIREVK